MGSGSETHCLILGVAEPVTSWASGRAVAVSSEEVEAMAVVERGDRLDLGAATADDTGGCRGRRSSCWGTDAQVTGRRL
jgi:hypothetical protein